MARAHATTFAQRQAAEGQKLARHIARCKAAMTPEQTAELQRKADAARVKLAASREARTRQTYTCGCGFTGTVVDFRYTVPVPICSACCRKNREQFGKGGR